MVSLPPAAGQVMTNHQSGRTGMENKLCLFGLSYKLRPTFLAFGSISVRCCHCPGWNETISKSSITAENQNTINSFIRS